MAVATKAPSRKRRKSAGRSAPPPSFTLKAAVTLIGYWVGWIPGALMNFLFLAEAKRVARECGRRPAGMTWLRVMLIVLFWLPLVLAVLILGSLLLLVRLDR